MAGAVIVGAGDFPRKEYPRYIVRSADRIVCCDGALKTWLRVAPALFGHERMPDMVVGDMDSLSPALQKKFAGRIFHVDEQDFNDQTKALRFVLAEWPDVDTIHFVGATGKREDHTIGNMALLMEYARALDGRIAPSDGLSAMMDKALETYRGRGLQLEMVTDFCTAAAFTDSVSLCVGQGRKVSIFSSDNSLKIKSAGLQWPTDDVVFDGLWKATLNRAAEDTITLTLSHPAPVLVILS